VELLLSPSFDDHFGMQGTLRCRLVVGDGYTHEMHRKNVAQHSIGDSLNFFNTSSRYYQPLTRVHSVPNALILCNEAAQASSICSPALETSVASARQRKLFRCLPIAHHYALDSLPTRRHALVALVCLVSALKKAGDIPTTRGILCGFREPFLAGAHFLFGIGRHFATEARSRQPPFFERRGFVE